MKKLTCFMFVLVSGILMGCGSGDPAPVQGDNAAATSGVTATPEQKASRPGGFTQTTNPPGTGRGATGNDLHAKP